MYACCLFCINLKVIQQLQRLFFFFLKESFCILQKYTSQIQCIHVSLARGVKDRWISASVCSPGKCGLFLFGEPLAATKPFVSSRIKSRVHTKWPENSTNGLQALSSLAHSLPLTFLPAPPFAPRKLAASSKPFCRCRAACAE